MSLDNDEERKRAEEIEQRILAKQPADRRGCPFCGSRDVQAMMRPNVAGGIRQPAIFTDPIFDGGHFPITMMVCGNCQFVMPFLDPVSDADVLE